MTNTPKPLPQIVFEEPPPALRRGNDPEWQPVVDALIARPSQWALIFEGHWRPGTNLAQRIRGRAGVWFGRTWEVRTRSVGEGQWEQRPLKVWTRYMPDTSPDPDAAYKAALENQINDETSETK